MNVNYNEISIEPQRVPKTMAVLSDEQVYAHTLRALVVDAVPYVEVCMARRLSEVSDLLRTRPISILITTAILPDGDVIDLLYSANRAKVAPDSVLLVASGVNEWLLWCASVLKVSAIWDPKAQSGDEFQTLVRGLCQARYVTTKSLVNASSRVRMLTQVEQLVLSIIGDGCDDQTASRVLQLKPATIQSVRRDLHRKLGVAHRGELISRAIQLGYVRFTSAGVNRPGFALLLEHCRQIGACLKAKVPYES